jgi:uncharacterized membrane protein YraQ (UPF0718 family)
LALGFVVAGLVQEFVPARILLKYFGKNDWKSLARASLAGLAVSVCSCGAIPLCVTLHRNGAATATALTFLLASPWAGLVQLFILNGFVGPANTGIIFVSALLVAFLSGLILAGLENRGKLDQRADSNLHLNNTLTPAEHPNTLVRRLSRAAFYSWDSFREMAKYLGIGLILAAIVAAFVPLRIITGYLGDAASFDPIVTAVPLAAAVELCSEGFSIFAGKLYDLGATLGVTFVIMMVGVSTDFTELSVIWGKIGRKSALWYVFIASFLSIVVAHFIDWVF